MHVRQPTTALYKPYKGHSTVAIVRARKGQQHCTTASTRGIVRHRKTGKAKEQQQQNKGNKQTSERKNDTSKGKR